jgi:TolB-like protein
MKLNLISILASTFLAGAATGAPTPPLTVAVYDFKGDGDASSWGGKVTTLVTADLSTETNLIMVERAELTKALNEEAFGISGMVSSDAAAKIGQITGAKVLVAGQVILTGGDHLVIVADIVGTETSRLFADKVEGSADNFLELTSNLSQKIAQTITDQATNLVMPATESRAEYLERLVKSVTGTNRPTVSVDITQHNQRGSSWSDHTADDEWGAILLKAGFVVVDDNSDRKPDLEITGDVNTGWGTQRGDLVTSRATIALKVQERRTGNIIALDRQESTATGTGAMVVESAAQIKAVDDLAERIIPLLAK